MVEAFAVVGDHDGAMTAYETMTRAGGNPALLRKKYLGRLVSEWFRSVVRIVVAVAEFVVVGSRINGRLRLSCAGEKGFGRAGRRRMERIRAAATPYWSRVFEWREGARKLRHRVRGALNDAAPAGRLPGR